MPRAMSRDRLAGEATMIATATCLVLALPHAALAQASGGSAPAPSPSAAAGSQSPAPAASPSPSPAASGAQATPRPPVDGRCERPEHGQLDFWVGEWEVSWSAARGESGLGTNRVTRDHGGCVIVERYQDNSTSFSGSSISSYRSSLGRWTMTFMATGGFYFEAKGGPAADGSVEFLIAPPAPGQPEGRIRFEQIQRDSFTWRFQLRPAGGEWTDTTVSQYRRRQSSISAVSQARQSTRG